MSSKEQFVKENLLNYVLYPLFRIEMPASLINGIVKVIKSVVTIRCVVFPIILRRDIL